jgi:ornithine carbamoyltransferase
MALTLKHRSLNEFAHLTAHDTAALLASARELEAAARHGRTNSLLKGKNFGLLCDAPDDIEAALFAHAATALGAQVARLHPNLTGSSTAAEVRHTAQVLGRLYDAVECVGLPAEVVQRIDASAGIPVFEALASARHPTAYLAALLDGSLSAECKRSLVIQAVLVVTFA